MKARPWFSIVTPSLNRAAGLRRAVLSVLAQRFEAFEHIIVDGGSVDDTPAVLRAFPHLRTVVEADDGIYAALNKGVSIARGRWLVFLNTDDAIPEGALLALARAGGRPGAAEQIGGWARICATGGNHLSWNRASMDLSELVFGAPVFNARAFAADLLRKTGPFDTTFALAGDRDYLIRLRLADASFERIDHALYAYTSHAGSLTLWPPTAERAACIAHEHACITARLLDEAPSVSEQAVLRAWLAYERSSPALRDRAVEARGGRLEAAWRLLAIALKARVALRRHTRIPRAPTVNRR